MIASRYYRFIFLPIALIILTGCATNKNLIRFEDGTTMNLQFITPKSADTSVVHDLDLLLIRKYYTYKVKTQNMVDGQKAVKEQGWGIYPSVEKQGQGKFPVELFIRTKEPVYPHSNYYGEFKKGWKKRSIKWTANEQRVPSHFGYCEFTAQDTVSGIEIKRECILLGDKKAQIKIRVRAPIPLLVRIWQLKGMRINVDPYSIQPNGYRLSDNGVLFYDYGKDPLEIGNEMEYSFVIHGLENKEIYYPMTNAMRFLSYRSQGCPKFPLKEVSGSLWGLDITLKSKHSFRIANLEKWINETYELETLDIKDNNIP